MRASRWLLLACSLASLALMAYAGLLVAFSTPVTDRMAAANALPGEPSVAAGARAIVGPAAGAPTHVEGREGPFGRAGALLVLARPGASFPSNAEDAQLVRALARVEAGATGNVTLGEVPVARNGTTERANLTVDLAALSGGRAGWIVKGDAETEPRFAEDAQVLGQAVGFEPTAFVLGMMGVGVAGFLAPLIVIVATHRAVRAPEGALAYAVCRDCRRPVAEKAEFCPACGAWLSERS